MNGFSIEIDSSLEEHSAVSNLVDSTGQSSLHITSSHGANETYSPRAIHLSSVDSANLSSHSELGGLVQSSIACVSDHELIQADYANQISEQMLFNSADLAAMSQVSEVPELTLISQQLLASLGEVSRGLAGELSPQELSMLIDSLQGQLLELNSASRNLFGELGEEISQDIHSVEAISADELLAAVEVGTSETLDYFGEHNAVGQSILTETTLDALFTNPEAFPLTLDFSSSDNLDNAAELFSHGSCSISSNAAGSVDSSSLDLNGDGVTGV